VSKKNRDLFALFLKEQNIPEENIQKYTKDKFNPQINVLCEEYQKYKRKEITPLTFKTFIHSNTKILGCVTNQGQVLVVCDTCPIFDWCQSINNIPLIKITGVRKTCTKLRKDNK
jgi:hypothetical protein